jgi:hypothetical protein
MSERTTFTEELHCTADKLIETIKELLHEGNVRHIVVKNPQGHTVVEVPVSVGVVGILIAPVLAAIGAIAVYAANFTLVVTREVEPPAPAPPSACEL